MLHALASVVKKSQLSTHRTFDFKSHNCLPKKIVVKCTLSESTSFTGLLTVSQLNVREVLPKMMILVLEQPYFFLTVITESGQLSVKQTPSA